MREIAIVVGLEWRHEDADGEICAVCGDVCFLGVVKAYGTLNNAVAFGPILWLCRSCGEVITGSELP